MATDAFKISTLPSSNFLTLRAFSIVVATDHRVNDGAHLGAFVSTLEQVIAGAERLVT